MYDKWITENGNADFEGTTWYRKHFTLGADLEGRNVFVEFEGVKQAGEFYINGVWVGRHEDGITPAGIDISKFVKFGAENVLAVQVNNNLDYKEKDTNQAYQWNVPNFYPNFGGLVSDVKLHVTDKLYQTLPLYGNLNTSGVYVYATNVNLAAHTANVTVEAEVQNSYGEQRILSYVVSVVDNTGRTVATGRLDNQTFAAGAKKIVNLTVALTDAHFWSPDMPYLYRVFSQLAVDNVTLDAVESPLGVRVVNFTLQAGLTINGKPIYLNGYAPRVTMEWVAVGQAPDWLAEYDFSLLRENNANFLRPMHCSPKRRDVEAADKFGVIYAAPAGDKEGDVTGIQWEQRVRVARDRTIYLRNHPSVVFYESGNQHVSPDHMREMIAIKTTWDPHGGRFVGTRSIGGDLAGIQEYGSPMDSPDGSATVPSWDAEYSRAECPRRVWDKVSPPYVGGYKSIAASSNTITEYPAESDAGLSGSEDLALANIWKYWNRWSKRGGQNRTTVMVGGAKIIFADSTSHGRMHDTEVARVSGAVDAARLPKQAYYALRVAHSSIPDLHILGHWTYPPNTRKKIYVIANTERVTLQVYDAAGTLVKDYGAGFLNHTFEFSWEDVAFVSGKIVAQGFNGNTLVKTMEIESVDEPTTIKLTPIVGPKGFIADGVDIAIVDVEVLDAKGRRGPLDNRRINFTYSGDSATFLGGYNSGVQNSLFKDSLLLESGINRVFLRSTRKAGLFTLTASADGLKDVTLVVASAPFSARDGLTLTPPPRYEIVPSGADIDDLPNQFRIVPRANLAIFDLWTSEPFVISGFEGEVNLTLTDATEVCSVSINGAVFVEALDDEPVAVKSGDSLRIKLATGSQPATTYQTKVTIGGVSAYYFVTSRPDE